MIDIEYGSYAILKDITKIAKTLEAVKAIEYKPRSCKEIYSLIKILPICGCEKLINAAGTCGRQKARSPRCPSAIVEGVANIEVALFVFQIEFGNGD